MNDNGQIPEELPRFDYSDYSYKEQKDLAKVTVRLSRLAAILPTIEDDTEYERKEAEYDRLTDAIESGVVKRIVSVPRSWLVPSAPKELDWTVTESLGWVRSDKMQALRDAATEARTPEAVSGN